MGFKGLGPHPTLSTLSAPSGLFACPKPSTSIIPTNIPSSGPSVPPSPPSTISTIPSEKILRRPPVDSYPTPTDPPSSPHHIRISPPWSTPCLPSHHLSTRATARRLFPLPRPTRCKSQATASPRHAITSAQNDKESSSAFRAPPLAETLRRWDTF